MLGKGIILLLVGAVVAIGWSKHEDRIREQDRLAIVASTIVGHKVGVRCPSFFKKLVNVSGEAGTVKFDDNGRPANHTNLAPETCDALRTIGNVDLSCLESSTCGEKQWKVAWAVHTLAHESFHMRGFAAEAQTECYAMQTTASVAVSLGIPLDRAAELQRWVWSRGYRNEPDEYTTTACHNGGQYDLHRGSAFWP